jgi:hypothetical protein
MACLLIVRRIVRYSLIMSTFYILLICKSLENEWALGKKSSLPLCLSLSLSHSPSLSLALPLYLSFANSHPLSLSPTLSLSLPLSLSLYSLAISLSLCLSRFASLSLSPFVSLSLFPTTHNHSCTSLQCLNTLPSMYGCSFWILN